MQFLSQAGAPSVYPPDGKHPADADWFTQCQASLATEESREGIESRHRVFALHSSIGEIFGQPKLLARIDDNRNAYQRIVSTENILAVPIIGRLLGHHHPVKLERAAC